MGNIYSRVLIYKRSLMIFIFLFIVTFFIPVKFTKKSLNDVNKYYICQITEVTDFQWIIIGDNHGLFPEKERTYLHLEGCDPVELLSKSIIINSKNTFLMYGNLTENSYQDSEKKLYSSLNCMGFDVVYPIDRGNSFRFFTPSNYLTVWDYSVAGLKKYLLNGVNRATDTFTF